MNLADDFSFSQSSLQDYDDCPRRFELRYIAGLRYPALEVMSALEYENHTRRGIRFHKMVHQHLLGAPLDLLAKSLGDDELLADWWANFSVNGLADLPAERHSEITLLTHLGGYRLTAKYDLLAIERGGAAVIIDWKTSQRIPSRWHLQKRVQTILYRYVLAQAGAHLYGSAIPPAKMQMIYVYVAREGKRVVFDYSPEQMQADEAALLQRIQEIEAAQHFPLTAEDRRCSYCTFRSLCERGEQAGEWTLGQGASLFDDDPSDDDDFDVDFDQIAEIEF